MGLFDIFKKKKKPDAILSELGQAEDFGTIAKILSENNLITAPKDEHHNSFGDDLQHLTADGGLPWGWVSYYKKFTDQQEKKIDTKWKAVHTATSTQEKLDAFNRYFDTVAKVGVLCKKTGECHYKWFCENILESVWYSEQIDKYERFKAEAPDLIKREELLSALDSDIMNKLRENNGILQSDFLKLFDPVVKKDVSDFLYKAEKERTIKRTKSGRSYILEIKP